ncbi:MAG TPA: hypothetical protein VL403_09140 [Candidatus Kryptonia bacterium]|nr:hypothetical protein [Candidatus Kryptonia bacterium]
MHVDVSCKKCGERRRIDVGEPGDQAIAEYVRLLNDRLMHRPSFECFGGHLEVVPPVPQFWVVHWETLGD